MAKMQAKIDVNKILGYKFIYYPSNLKIRFPSGTMSIHTVTPFPELRFWFVDSKSPEVIWLWVDIPKAAEILKNTLRQLKKQPDFMLDLCEEILDGSPVALSIRGV